LDRVFDAGLAKEKNSFGRVKTTRKGGAARAKTQSVGENQEKELTRRREENRLSEKIGRN